MTMQGNHITQLNQFWTNHRRPIDIKYPNIFDPKWTMLESGYSCFRLSVFDDQPWKTMHEEAERLIEYFYPHREDYGNGWKSLTLHGVDDDSQSLDSYGIRKDVIKELRWTWVADRCPATKKFLTDVWPAEYLNRVRFMLVEPGGYILPHQDRPDDQKRLSVCNISLNNPAGCEFIFKDHGVVPFGDNGSAFLMDISNVHAVWNRSDIPRIHMIIHFEIGRRLRDFFYVLRSSFYRNIDKEVKKDLSR